VDQLVAILQLVAGRLEEWRGTNLADLQFWHRDTARLAVILFIAVSGGVLLARSLLARGRRNRIVLPALLPIAGDSTLAFVRHTPLLLLLSGLPFFVVALADPYTSLTQRQETFPGRRICLMIDASSSMVRWFNAPTLKQASGPKTSNSSQVAFSTSVAAAERFVRLRIEGKYRDLMALVEFGDQAYVVTPFTHDYDNILLSLSLIGDYSEFMRFPDQGTILSRAVEQGTRLFKAFDALNAAGNIMVIFSDGEDSGVLTEDRTVNDVVNEAVAAKIPIFLVRINNDKTLGALVPDAMWKAAVGRTGGRFYAAADEGTILQAIGAIDRVAEGRIEVTQYVTQRPKFVPFALAAAAIWSLALMLKLTVPYFRTFP
jgi:hypothetical protein